MNLNSFQNVLNPTGEAFLRPENKFPPSPHCSLADVFSTENIRSAWRQVKTNRGAPGVDGISVEEFPAKTRSQWKEVKLQVLQASYFPKPAKRVEIPKANGGIRLLGIPTVQDRLIQQGINQVLTPVFDPTFSLSSYGFRPQRSAHDAIGEILRWYQRGYRIAVDIDLEKFFDTVNHRVLMSRVSRQIKNPGILKLIRRYLRSGVVVKGRLNQTRHGVPQGSPLSPLLSNILLDDLDKELEKRGHKFARYADDVMILVKSKRAGERVMESITRFLEKKLKVDKRQAVIVGRSRKGYWKLSKTLSTNMGLTNDFLQKQGLVSIRQLWIKCHYPVTTR